MPEGPEVRTAADKLRAKILNKTLDSIEKLAEYELIGEPTLPATITKVYSHGKKLFFHLSTDFVIITSYKMTGKYIWDGSKGKNIIKLMIDGVPLYYQDGRKIGNIRTIPVSQLDIYMKPFGPDLLSHAISNWLTTDQWNAIFAPKRKTRMCVARVLQMQELIAGIGNYLKSEILYYAAILPNRPMNTISDAEMDNLRMASHQVILTAYHFGGLTIESYINPDGELGLYPNVVYGKFTDFDGNEVVRGKTKDGRTSFWVPSKQF